MNTPFVTGRDYSPSAGPDAFTPLANCFLGVQSQEAIAMARQIIDARSTLGTRISSDPFYGNSTIQGNARQALATLLNTDVRHITLTANTHDGFCTVRDGLQLGKQDKVLMWQGEYVDLKTPVAHRNDTVATPEIVRFEGDYDTLGRPIGFSIEQVQTELLKHLPSVLVVSHIQFASSFPTDVKQLSTLCKQVGTTLIVDVAQSLGALSLSPEDLGCDALVAPLWKWVGGLRGAGVLWTSDELRARMKVPRLSASGLQGASFTSDVDMLPLHGDGRDLETSTMATDGVWAPTGIMIAEKANLTSAAIGRQDQRLLQVAREVFEGSTNFRVFQPDENFGSSFLALKLNRELFGRENEVIDELGDRRLDMTHRAGYVRFAPHHFLDEDDVRKAATIVREVIEAKL